MTPAISSIANRCRFRVGYVTRLGLVGLMLTALAACATHTNHEVDASDSRVAQSISTLGGLLSPYRPDVLQGNVLTQAQVQRLSTGLTRDQVAGLLGTPLLKNVFHNNRWDYVFTSARQGVPVQRRRLTLWFEGDKLVKFEGDDMPTEQEFVQSISTPVDTSDALPLQATPEQLKRFQEQQEALKRQNDAPAPTNAAVPSASSYPALNAQEAK